MGSVLLKLSLGLVAFVVVVKVVQGFWAMVHDFFFGHAGAAAGLPTPAEAKIVVKTQAEVDALEKKRQDVKQEVAGESIEQVVDGLNGGPGHARDD